ncbi:MAG: rRNA adenine N-6-methyltransferase family protein, partial [Desulfovibrionaceae bacterium]|nr:rRNA adenine N-6-methyltransferase family protein [Desulfovibrionaceae bacterium]
MQDSSTSNAFRDNPAPKKSLGQHFLRRPEICQHIAGLLDLEQDDQVLEIGPGPGALTDVL